MSSSISSSASATLLAAIVASAASLGCAHAPRPERQAVTRIAIFPVEIWTQGPAPRESFSAELAAAIRRTGVEVVTEEEAEPYLARARVRGGGVDEIAAAVAREELNVDAVLLPTIESHLEAGEPSLAVTTRLVSVTERPQVLWVDGFAEAAAASHGILGLGGFHSMAELEREAAVRLARSFQAFLATGARGERCTGRKFRPRRSFRAPGPLPGPRAIVLPLLNRSTNAFAGDFVGLHLVRQLVASGRFEVVDPGAVREALRKERIVTQGGVSPIEAQRMAKALDVDLVLSGEVVQLEETDVPKAEFTVLALDRDERVVFQSSSRATGDDAATVFDRGRLSTISEVVCRMTTNVVAKLAGGK